MKKLLLLILVLWQLTALNAQTYIPFPDSAVVWVNATYEIGPGNNPWDPPYHQLNSVANYCMSGLDTTINTNFYSKLTVCEGAYKGGIRDNHNGKVYFIPKDSTQEFLLYDFTLNVGDTVTYYMDAPLSNPVYGMLFTDHVQSVGTMTANGVTRKTISFGGGISWIEGIGNTMGLFAETWINVSNYSRELYCMSLDNASLFHYPNLLDPSVSGSCSLTLGVNDFKENDFGLSVFPNPNTGKFQLKCKDQKLDVIEITDVLGNSVLKKRIINETTDLDLSENTNGIYFIIIVDSRGNFVVKKIVKQ